MKKLIAFIALATLAFGQPVTQIGNGNVSGTLYFGGATTGGNVTGASGALSLTALGTDQNITLKPSGTGIISFSESTGGATLTPSSSASVFQFIGANSSNTTLEINSFAAQARIRGRRANGTIASRTSIASGDTMLNLQSQGYYTDVADYGGGAGANVIATENWVTGKTGSKWAFTVIGLGNTTVRGALTLEDNGRITGDSSAVTGQRDQPAWGTTGSYLAVGGGKQRDTSSSGTVASAVCAGFGIPTFEASSATTFTNAANLYIAGDVAAGTNVTLTNSYGLWNAGKTHLDGAVQLPSTNTAGLQLYNTADQTTNYERLEALWSSNVATIRTAGGGSGTVRALNLSVGSSGGPANLLINPGGASRFAFSVGTISTATHSLISAIATNTATSGSNPFVSIAPTYNQASGTAANTDLLINRTQTAVGSGAQLLADFQVGGSSKFSVSNVAAATLTHTSNPSITTTDGTVISFLGVNSAGIKAQLGTNSNHAVEILQNGGLAVSFGTSKQATFAGALITTPQALSGAGAVNVTTSATFLTSTGVGDALTLANATEGQIKYIVHKVDGGSAVLTPTSKIGFTTITFTNVGDSVTLIYTSAGWSIVGIFGAVAA